MKAYICLVISRVPDGRTSGQKKNHLKIYRNTKGLKHLWPLDQIIRESVRNIKRSNGISSMNSSAALPSLPDGAFLQSRQVCSKQTSL